jgi:hypothetical protein
MEEVGLWVSISGAMRAHRAEVRDVRIDFEGDISAGCRRVPGAKN